MKQRLDRDVIGMRAAKELRDGDCVNLGFGIPTLCALYVPEGVRFQTEAGLLGYGRLVMADEIEKADWHYIDASGRFCTPAPGMAIFDVVTSFAMIRSGRLISIMGGFQVSGKGDLANWNTGGDALGGTIGGAMDLAVGSRMVIITMDHTTKEGDYRIVKKCSYPLTAKECVDLIVTDLAVIEVTPEGLLLKEVAPGWTAEEVQALTEPKLIIAPDLKEIEL
ncbi:MAG: succinyl-CoA--3-ketoacid-CoA transferase [Dehalococcoidia bacterium]|nr:MAG: succinyl-CoA--3-ketoacid-CoA transferase [Dehalococcoidia bacterium]